MPDRPLDAGEKALWQKLIATVQPIQGHRPARMGDQDVDAMVRLPAKAPVGPTKKKAVVHPTALSRAPSAPYRGHVPSQPPPKPINPGELDGHWDRRMAKGGVYPDVTVDLHGYNLSSAYTRLDGALEMAIASGLRTILLITGKARPDHERGLTHGRGAIRAAVTDWLAVSRHSDRIAAVRNAHPKHGGQGALYIILRRAR